VQVDKEVDAEEISEDEVIKDFSAGGTLDD